MDLAREGKYRLPKEQIEYDREHLEEQLVRYIGGFMSEKEILRRFGFRESEMDEICNARFGFDFHEVYSYIRSDVIMQGKQVIEELAYGGNPSALKIFADCMLKLNQEEEAESKRLTINIDV